MPEHYTLNTLEDTKWCNRCGKPTQHSVSGNRIGRCLEHHSPELTKKQQRHHNKLENERRNPTLFPLD